MLVPVALARALACHGVRSIFGVTGDANRLLVDSFVANRGDYIEAASEPGATHMGFGYASLTRRPGVVTVPA
jgi:acetolactate synthase-1/2/3 large subunit